MPLTIIGLGPGAVDDLSLKAWRTLEQAQTVYLRTKRHPCVPDLPNAASYHSFDELYETLDSFEEVYATITARLIEAAKLDDVVYAVPGDPLVGESTVTRLLQAANESAIEVEIINGISFIEPMLAQLKIDALDGLQIIDALTITGMHHPPINPDFPALLAQVYSREVASNVKLTLMNQYPDEFPVKLIHGAGTGEMQVESIPLYEIDRSQQINHLTSLYLPAQEKLSSFESFQEVIAHLRAPEGCPWDRKQTHESLRPYLLEETYEVLEAIDAGDTKELAAELGDLLLQIVLHTQIAIDEGEFYMGDVLRNVNQKMIRRHPHVWGDVDVNGDADKVLANWETIKQAENAGKNKVEKSILDSIPKALPSLMLAQKYQAKAAKVGFDWDTVKGVEEKFREEVEEIFSATSDDERIKEIGDLLFVIVNWLRWLGTDDPESVLRETAAKFYKRFHYVEQAVQANGTKAFTEYTLAELDAFWNEAKAKGL